MRCFWAHDWEAVAVEWMQTQPRFTSRDDLWDDITLVVQKCRKCRELREIRFPGHIKMTAEQLNA